jgi:hypothetical protein
LQPWTEIPHLVDLVDDNDAGLDLVVQSRLRALRHAEFAFPVEPNVSISPDRLARELSVTELLSIVLNTPSVS